MYIYTHTHIYLYIYKHAHICSAPHLFGECMGGGHLHLTSTLYLRNIDYIYHVHNTFFTYVLSICPKHEYSTCRFQLTQDIYLRSFTCTWRGDKRYLHTSAQVNPKSTSNQSSKPCTVLQYPSTKEVSYIHLVHHSNNTHSTNVCLISVGLQCIAAIAACIHYILWYIHYIHIQLFFICLVHLSTI